MVCSLLNPRPCARRSAGERMPRKRSARSSGSAGLENNENMDPRLGSAGRDPLSARLENLESGRRKKKAGCFSFLGSKRSRKRKAEPSDGVDLGASNVEIPGGLAGIRARMAEMGHHMNVPPENKMAGQGMDAYDVDAAPAGPNEPNAHKETMSGEGFVLMSDFCTEDGRQAAVKPKQRRGPGASKKSRPADTAPRVVVPPPEPEPEPEPEPDILERKNADGSEMTIEQLLNQFKPESPQVSRRPSANAPSAAPAAPILLGQARGKDEEASTSSARGGEQEREGQVEQDEPPIFIKAETKRAARAAPPPPPHLADGDGGRDGKERADERAPTTEEPPPRATGRASRPMPFSGVICMAACARMRAQGWGRRRRAGACRGCADVDGRSLRERTQPPKPLTW